MTRAIVLVDHGSRRNEANAQLEQVALQVRERFPDRLVVTAHLEIATPDIGQAIASCAERGVSEIVVHPYFLAPGRHTSRDIPEQVATAAAQFPRIRICISEALGLHAGVIDAVIDRIDAARSVYSGDTD